MFTFGQLSLKDMILNITGAVDKKHETNSVTCGIYVIHQEP